MSSTAGKKNSQSKVTEVLETTTTTTTTRTSSASLAQKNTADSETKFGKKCSPPPFRYRFLYTYEHVLIFSFYSVDFGRLQDSQVKSSDYLQSKEYSSVLEKVKDAAVDRLKVEAHISANSCALIIIRIYNESKNKAN
jgi:hypothetical protein